MSEIYYDNGTLFFILETGEAPSSPYWTDFIKIGAFAARIDTDDNGNWIFADEDGKVMGLQMEDPLTDDGVPKESVLHWLRDTLPESDIVWFLDSVRDAKAQMAEAEAS